LSDPHVTLELAYDHGLTEEEYARILDLLGRTPTFPELGIFSVMWSEHCSYKSSKVHLATLPTEGPQVLEGPGENAGIVEIGEGLAAVFKIESHNHPSYVEPHAGAATGVGGILRDIFTMGARPLASLNSLRFGLLDDPHQRYLLRGVVQGIGDYGNCFGCATVGGEVTFHSRYRRNVLVNAMNVGVVRKDQIFRARAAGPGNPVVYVGSKTGRDGIHGASLLASSEFTEETESMRPTVQVGDPFTEKLLLEGCLEAMTTGAIVGIQDMGAAGLTCSSFEMASHSGTGIDMDLDRVPLREAGMTPYEMLLSESQERMLLVVERGREAEVEAVFRKWELDFSVIGEVTDDGRMRARHRGRTVVDIPVDPIAKNSPVCIRPAEPPKDLEDRRHLDLSSIPTEKDPGEALLALLGSPNSGSTCSTIRASRPARASGPEGMRPWFGCRERRGASPSPPTATHGTAGSTRAWVRSMPSPRRPET
jgi:phosphoribosylformylglycinamidine synthase